MTPTTDTLERSSRRASEQANHFLAMGASVGAIGLLGALAGAVCPLCVVATPALVSFGVVQKLRGWWLRARAKKSALAAPTAERG